MKRALTLCIALIALSGCTRNGEYRYVSELRLLESTETLVPRMRERLRTSDFRKNYDQNLVYRIGSSFKDFEHIRAYQSVLDDALIYIMIKTGIPHLNDDLRSQFIPPLSKLILSRRSGEDLLAGIDKIVQIVNTNDAADRASALAAYDAELKAIGE